MTIPWRTMIFLTRNQICFHLKLQPKLLPRTISTREASEETLNIFINHGKDAEAFHSANSSVDEFRTLAFKALKNTKNGSGVVVNYHMAELGQGQLGGHHSPLGAYHKDSDRFLIFDTWYDTEECWATTEDLFRSMTGIDKFSGKTRGFLVVHGHF